MKKILSAIGFVAVLLILVSCSDVTAFIEPQNGIFPTISQGENMYPPLGNAENEQNTLSDIPSASLRMFPPETYTLKHEDGITYVVYFEKISIDNYVLHIYDLESNLLQYIPMEFIFRIEFDDVNKDGYTDIMVTTYGTLNEEKELFIYDASIQQFTQVNFEGFDLLSNFDAYNGYIMNQVKLSGHSGYNQKLIWKENTLILKWSEPYNLRDFESTKASG